METSSPLISAVPISLVLSAEDEIECVDVKVISFPTVSERRNSLDSKAQSYGEQRTRLARERMKGELMNVAEWRRTCRCDTRI